VITEPSAVAPDPTVIAEQCSYSELRPPLTRVELQDPALPRSVL
jgi:hypothetical protein